jgi:hypothetical protein
MDLLTVLLLLSVLLLKLYKADGVSSKLSADTIVPAPMLNSVPAPAESICACNAELYSPTANTIMQMINFFILV